MVRPVGADPDLPAVQLARANQYVFGLLFETEKPLGDAKQAVAELGRHDTPATPIEQAYHCEVGSTRSFASRSGHVPRS